MSGPSPDHKDDEHLVHNVAMPMANSLLVLQRRTVQELLEATRLLEQRGVALSMSVSLLNATLESAPDGIIAFDLAGNILALNTTFAAIWGLTTAEVRAGTFDALLAHEAGCVLDPETFLRRIRTARMSPQRAVHDIVGFRDGRTFERSAVPQVIDGECVGMVAHWRDVTEQRRSADAQLALADQLRQAQKMESLGILSGGIAHDFNNILGAIIGNAELALAMPQNEAGMLESLAAIREAADRAARLVQQILTFSRQQAHERSPMALGATVREAARLLRVTIPAGIELTTAIDDEAPLVLADATQVHQIVMNLCTNAMHALQERTNSAGRVGGIAIRVEQGNTGIGSDAPGTLAADRYVRLVISDNGVGMDEQTQARIFKPFFTTRQPGDGTGLGLSVVHGIMEAHHGAITVESTRDVGTTFALYFPAIDAAPVTTRRTPLDLVAVAAEPVEAETIRVLYVDDDALIVSLVSRLLGRSGCTVTGFRRAQEALTQIRLTPNDFDVVITDFNMPEFSGLDIARAVRDVRPALPVVITSGYISAELQSEATQAGVQHLLYKPDLAKRLLQIVQAISPAQHPEA